MKLSFHAAQRLQQRAIPPFVVKLLTQHGTATRACGADRLYFDRAARERLSDDFDGIDNMKMIERWLGVYAIVGDDGRVITVAHQTKRRRRH